MDSDGGSTPVPDVARSDRNSLAARRELPFRAWVATTTLGGALVLTGTAFRLDAATLLGMQPAFWAVCALLLGVELRPLLTAGARDPNGQVLTSAFVFALLLRYGIDVAVLVQALATTVIDLSRRKALWRTAFNVSQYTLSWAAAAAAMALLDFRPAPVPTDLEAAQLLPAAVGGLTYFVVNQLLVTVVVALKVGRPWWVLMREDLAYEGLSNAALLALSPLIVLAVEEGVAFLPLLLPPIVVVYGVGAVALDRERQAMTDALTGLANRKRLAERTAAALEEDGPGPALLLFDLDRFKEVNDTLGHHVGDRLLVLVGSRLTAAVREDDSVARLGGDEFAVLLPGASGRVAGQTAQRLLAELALPIVLEGVLVDVRASVGVAVAPQDGETLDDLLQHADVAMYLAKERGGGVELYDVRKDRNSTDRLGMVGELRRALTHGELELHYQPKAELQTGQVRGVEALVRWRHPERGLVPPDDFVPLAESCGLVELLTARVLDTAVEQLAAWHGQGLQLSMAVNVSVRDLAGGLLADRVSTALSRHGVDARWLQLELTEGSLFAESALTATTLRQLDELGVTLSLDDFGTGYSSLSHLRRLPVQELKIDRSFVQRLGDDARDRAVVRSIVDLAEGLGMRVVAEGVEDRATWQVLRELSCDVAQGWYVCRPQPADVLTPWLHAHDRAFADG